MQVGSLIAFLSYFMQILMAVLLATFILVIIPARVGVRRTHLRGAVHRAADHQPRASRTGRAPSTARSGWTQRRSAIPAPSALCSKMFR